MAAASMSSRVQFRCTTLSILLLLLLHVNPVECAKKKSKPRPIDTTKYADVCTGLSKTQYPPLKPNDKRRHRALQTIIDASGLQNLLLLDSPRLKAACWILYDDAQKVSGTRRLRERYALAVLYHATQGPQWKESTNWMTGAHESKWLGVTTSRPSYFSLGKSVTKVTLTHNKLNGLLPRELSLLTNLRELDLHGNDLQGVLPHKALSELKKLEVLELYMNNILGQIPTEIGLMKSLKVLDLFGNYLEGPIPRRVGQLSNLEHFDVSFTYMGGAIPREIGECKKLKEVYLNYCDFTGSVPSSLCKLKDLKALAADCLGPNPEVSCECCTICCRGLPDPKCVEMKKSASDEAAKKKKKKK